MTRKRLRTREQAQSADVLKEMHRTASDSSDAEQQRGGVQYRRPPPRPDAS